MSEGAGLRLILGGKLPLAWYVDGHANERIMGMDEDTRKRLLSGFDSAPAGVEEYRHIVRALIHRIGRLNAQEAEIMAWDSDGRDPTQFEQIRRRAWAFSEVGEVAFRKRLFAGFVTSADEMDGYSADYLIDYALAAGVTPNHIFEIMGSRSGG